TPLQNSFSGGASPGYECSEPPSRGRKHSRQKHRNLSARQTFPMIVHPSRRVSFDETHCLSQTPAWRQVKEHVDVILHTSHRHWDKVNVLANSCQVLPQSFLKIFRDELRALFGTEHRMQMMLGECMRHGLSPLPGLNCISHASHRLRGGLQHFAPAGAG